MREKEKKKKGKKRKQMLFVWGTGSTGFQEHTSSPWVNPESGVAVGDRG